MTVESEQAKAKAQPISIGTSVNMSETKFQPLADEAPMDCHHGLPPQLRKRKRRAKKRACCCLSLLLFLNLMIVAYIAKKVTYISYVLMDSPVAYMPGGTHPFCSDLCVDLCINENDSSESSFSCDISDCMDACSSHFDMDNDDSDDTFEGGEMDTGVYQDEGTDEDVDLDEGMMMTDDIGSSSGSSDTSGNGGRSHMGKRHGRGNPPRAADKDRRVSDRDSHIHRK